MKAERLNSGNYRCKVYLGKDKDGRKKYKSITGASRKAVEAEAARFALLNRAEVGNTVERAMDEFIDSRRATKSPSTIRGYVGIKRRMVNRFPWLTNKKVCNVTTSDIQIVTDELTKICSPKTVTNETALLVSSLKQAGAVIDSPILPQKVKPTYNIPSNETVRYIIDLSRGTQLEVPILLAAFAPLRRGEICALSWDDIDRDWIHVRHDMVRDEHGDWVIKAPKTLSSDRVIRMDHAVIERMHEVGLCEMTPNSLTQAFQRFLKRNNIERFRLHDLRHWCCSYLHSIGVPDVYIMQRSGHSDYSTLRKIYTHTLQDQSEIETERILTSFRGISRGISVSKTIENRPNT